MGVVDAEVAAQQLRVGLRQSAGALGAGDERLAEPQPLRALRLDLIGVECVEDDGVTVSLVLRGEVGVIDRYVASVEVAGSSVSASVVISGPSVGFDPSSLRRSPAAMTGSRAEYLIMTLDVSRATPKYTARVAHYPPGSPFGPRKLRDHELVWILSGSATWEYRHPQLPGPQRHALRPGDVVIAGAGGTDSYVWDERGPSSHAYIHFDLPGLDPSRESWTPVRETRRSDVVWALCGYLRELSNRDADDGLAATQRGLVVLLEAFVARRSSAPDPRLADGPIVTALDYVRDVWTADGMQIMPLDMLAGNVGLTAGHLSRLFSRAFGHGLSASLELVRLGRSAIELQRSNLTLDEIARHAGFANPYHFSRRFSQAYGMPPGRFRRSPQSDALAPLATAGLMPVWNVLQES